MRERGVETRIKLCKTHQLAGGEPGFGPWRVIFCGFCDIPQPKTVCEAVTRANPGPNPGSD